MKFCQIREGDIFENTVPIDEGYNREIPIGAKWLVLEFEPKARKVIFKGHGGGAHIGHILEVYHEDVAEEMRKVEK